VSDDFEHGGDLTTGQVPMRPNKLARVLSTVLVSVVMAAIVTKVLGKKAGIIALLVTASAHEVLDAPVARFLGERFDLVTT